MNEAVGAGSRRGGPRKGRGCGERWAWALRALDPPWGARAAPAGPRVVGTAVRSREVLSVESLAKVTRTWP